MKYGLFLLLSLFMLQACEVEDKGNYDYTPQNGVTITFASDETNQTLEKGVDTLMIHPTVVGDVYGENEDNYEYKWFFCSGQVHEHTVVGTTKNLSWPVSLKPGNYTLYFQVIDKGTGLEWLNSTSVTVFSELTQGWMLLGETPYGMVQMDMLVMKPDGSLVLIKDIFDNSDLQLKGGRSLVFTGNRSGQQAKAHLWLMTDEKDVKLTWGNNFLPVGEFHNMVTVEEMEVSKITPRLRNMFPRQSNCGYGTANTMRNYQSRGVVTDSAIYMTTLGYDGSEVYVNPMNRYSATSKEFFKPYHMAFVLGGTRPTGNVYPLFYDMDDNCFVKPGAVYGTNATYCSKLADRPGDPFPWNQYKRTIVYGENLRNSSSDNACNCVALMKDTEGEDINYYVYTFRPGAKGWIGTALSDPTKISGYTVDKTVAVDFDKATCYTFMSNSNVLLYSVGSTLYAYNYTYKTINSMELESDISRISADAVLSIASFWVSTYDEGSQKGELKLMQLGGTQMPEFNYDEEDCWPLTMKMVDIEWKYGEDPAEEEPDKE